MFKFKAYIEYLLMTRHYCYVPGHGAYMLADEPAEANQLPSIGAGSKRLYTLNAPCRNVVFSPLHTHDDGILANLLMEAESMTYDEACRYIERQVPLLDDDFVTEALADTDVENFGFESLQLQTWVDIESQLNPPAEPEQKEVKPIASADTIAIPRAWLQRAAMIALVVVFFFTNFTGLNNGPAQQAAILDVAKLQMNAESFFVDSFLDKDQNTDADTTCEASSEPTAISPTESAATCQAEVPAVHAAPTVAKAAASTTHYYIIVASTVSEEEAASLVRRYTRDGYNHVGVLAKNTLYRVYTERFDQKDEAISYLRQLRQVNQKLAKAWMLPLDDASLSYIIKDIYNDNQLSMELSHPNQRTERDQG